MKLYRKNHKMRDVDRVIWSGVFLVLVTAIIVLAQLLFAMPRPL